MTDSAKAAAQKVLAAFKDRHELCFPFEDWVQLCLAAALRAAADEVVPENRHGPAENAAAAQREITRRELLAIAAELEGQP